MANKKYANGSTCAKVYDEMSSVLIALVDHTKLLESANSCHITIHYTLILNSEGKSTVSNFFNLYSLRSEISVGDLVQTLY
jgi:hypothetical protein